MALPLTTSNTVLGALAPSSAGTRLAGTLLAVVGGTLLLTLSAKVNVPVWPVPVTLQTFAVAALAAGFGWRIGVATVALYIVEGLAGLPVFAGAASGPAYLLGPTGGFIVSWLLMAAIIGRAADAGLSRKPVQMFGFMLLADAVQFVVGFGWLVAVLAAMKGVGPDAVLASAYKGAIEPFVIWDVLKMALAALTVAGCWTLIRRKP
jgi:biotin transport system substrate-specific component